MASVTVALSTQQSCPHVTGFWLAHDRGGGLIEGGGWRLGLEVGAIDLLLERNPFEEKGVALEIRLECCQFPERLANPLLPERKRAARLQFPQEASAERNVVNEVPAHAADAMVPVIGNEVAGHAAEDARLTRRRMEIGVGFEVQGGSSCGCAALRPEKGNGQKLEKVVNLLVVVIVLGDLFILGFGVLQKILNEIALLRLGQSLFVPLEDALDVALLRSGDPLENVFFRLADFFQIDPVRVVSFVCLVFGVDNLLNDLLRTLCLRNREPERERERPYPQKACFFLAHLTAFAGQNLTAY